MNNFSLLKQHVSSFQLLEYKDWYFDLIQKPDNYFEVWLYHANYGIKDFVFGARFDNCVELFNLLKNFDFDAYIRIYTRDFID